MKLAYRALTDLSLLRFSLRTTEFSRCRIIDFADGSYIVLHHNGRIEANSYNP